MLLDEGSAYHHPDPCAVVRGGNTPLWILWSGDSSASRWLERYDSKALAVMSKITFDKWILPRTSIRCFNFFDTAHTKEITDSVAIDPVVVSKQEPGLLIERWWRNGDTQGTVGRKRRRHIGSGWCLLSCSFGKDRRLEVWIQGCHKSRDRFPYH